MSVTDLLCEHICKGIFLRTYIKLKFHVSFLTIKSEKLKDVHKFNKLITFKIKMQKKK